MKKFLKNSNSGIISLIEIIVGVLLLINHNAVISYFMIIAGAILAVSGVVSLIKYFIAKPDEAKRGSLTGALVSLSIGIFLIICKVNTDAVLQESPVETEFPCVFAFRLQILRISSVW